MTNKVSKWPRRRPRSQKCSWCRTRFRIKRRGRVPLFCSRTCRQRDYETRRAAENLSQPQRLLRRDLNEARDKALVREVVREELQKLGLLPSPPPPPRRSHLRSVK